MFGSWEVSSSPWRGFRMSIVKGRTTTPSVQVYTSLCMHTDWGLYIVQEPGVTIQCSWWDQHYVDICQVTNWINLQVIQLVIPTTYVSIMFDRERLVRTDLVVDSQRNHNAIGNRCTRPHICIPTGDYTLCKQNCAQLGNVLTGSTYKADSRITNWPNKRSSW
jgi:hypothetical protein